MANSFLGTSGIGKSASDWYKANNIAPPKPPAPLKPTTTVPSTTSGGRQYAYNVASGNNNPSSTTTPSTSAAGRQYAQDQVAAGKVNNTNIYPTVTYGSSSPAKSTPPVGTGSGILGIGGQLGSSIVPYKTAADSYKANNLPIPSTPTNAANLRQADSSIGGYSNTPGGGSSGSGKVAKTSFGGSTPSTAPSQEYMQQLQQQFTPEYQATETPSQQQQQQPQIDFTPYFSQIGSIMNQVSDQGKALIAQLSSDFLQELNSMQSQIEQQFGQMMGGVDPATQQALSQLKADVEGRQKSILEFLNSRGIAQSGMTVEQFGKLAGSANDQEMQLISGNLKDLQNQMLSQMWNFAQARINAMSQFGDSAMGQFNQYAKGIESGLKNSMDMASTQYVQQQQSQREQMQQQNQNYRAELPYQYPTANELMPYQYGATPYQQGQLNIGQQNAATSAQNAQTTAQRLSLEQQQFTQNQQVKQTSTQIQSKAFSFPPEQAIQFVQQNAQSIIAEVGADEYAKILRNVQEYAYS